MEKPVLMNVKQASEHFGIGRNKLYSLLHKDETVPYIKIGKHFKINSVLFQNWLDEKTENGERL